MKTISRLALQAIGNLMGPINVKLPDCSNAVLMPMKGPEKKAA